MGTDSVDYGKRPGMKGEIDLSKDMGIEKEEMINMGLHVN